MSRYTSQITFLYYQDLEYGEYVMSTILDLPVVMDQGFAKIYQVGNDSFLGIVQTTKTDPIPGDTLVSLNTTDLNKEFARMESFELKKRTEIIYHKEIPLYSFFFSDKEDHRFEIQMFETDEDLKLF